ncbi:hypothetical protein KQI52_00110 [bacterium]|nr:hypothetical protein [bacterium]
MHENLVMICVTAFTAVFSLLALLAAVMAGITRLAAAPATATVKKAAPPAATSPKATPAPAVATHDQARIAAISSAYRRLFPDKSVIHIEEIG